MSEMLQGTIVAAQIYDLLRFVILYWFVTTKGAELWRRSICVPICV